MEPFTVAERRDHSRRVDFLGCIAFPPFSRRLSCLGLDRASQLPRPQLSIPSLPKVGRVTCFESFKTWLVSSQLQPIKPADEGV